MSMSPETEALMLAYVYGELEGEAEKAFEGQLASDPDLKAEVEGMLAMRDLLDADMAYGEESGLDEPPPHLRDAIFRAEALSPPPELKVAVVSASRPDEESWVKRFGAWLLGGGALVGAAAAATLVVGLSKQEAPEVRNLTADKSASAVEASVATASPDPTATPPEGGASAAFDDNKRDMAAAADEPTGEPEPAADLEPAVTAAEGATSSLAKLQQAASDPRMPAPSQQAPMPLEAKDRKDMKALAGDFDDAIDAPGALVGKAVDSSSGRAGYGVAKKPAPAPPPAKAAAPMAPEEESVASSFADEAAEDDDERPAPKTARRASEPASTGARAETRVRSIGSDFGGGGAPAPAAAPAPQSNEPPPLPEGLKEAVASAKQKKAAKGKAIVETDRLSGAMREKNKQNAEMLLLSAFHELELGRPSDALALFEKAERQDPKGRELGIKPIVGQMLAWQALGNPNQVLVLFARIESAGPLAEGAVQGYLVAGGAAEKLGRLTDAERIYQTLGKAPKGRRQAQAGLDRVRAAKASTDAEAAEAP